MPRRLQLLRRALLRLDDVRVHVRDGRRDGRRRLVEPGRDLELALVHLLDALQLLALRDLLQVLGRAVEQRDADVRLLERADVVRAVARHERDVAERLERREDVLLLRGRHACVDPRVLHEAVP